jgi:hypothetical protein
MPSHSFEDTHKLPAVTTNPRDFPPAVHASTGPWTHRALLTLEEKGIPYKMLYVQVNNKPQWLLDINSAGTNVISMLGACMNHDTTVPPHPRPHKPPTLPALQARCQS